MAINYIEEFLQRSKSTSLAKYYLLPKGNKLRQRNLRNEAITTALLLVVIQIRKL